mgnify:CR=1 FL=1
MRSCSARSLTLVRCSAFIAWGGDTCRFHQLILSLSHQGKAAAMMAAEVLPCVSSLDLSCGPCSRFVPPPRVFLVHPCRSKQAAAFLIYPVSPLASCPVPSKPPPRCPRCLIRFARPSRPSSRLASRFPSRSHAVPPLVPFLVSSRLARCAERLAAHLAVAPFCSACLAVFPIPYHHHRFMTG